MDASRFALAWIAASVLGLGAAPGWAGIPLEQGAIRCPLYDLGNLPSIPASLAPYGYAGPWMNGEIFDSSDSSNVVVLLPDYADNTLVMQVLPDVPAGVGWRPEERLIYGVNQRTPGARAALAFPVAADYMIHSRPTEESRQALPPDSPEEQLMRYIILTYPTVAAAQRAETQLSGLPGVAFAHVNQRYSGGVPNPYQDVRPTPLFAFYSPGRQDYFYTISPIAGSMAIDGSLSPTDRPDAPESRYHTVGQTIPYYDRFPNGAGAPVMVPGAQVWVFSTPTNPVDLTDSLAPLYRLSWKCDGKRRSQVCAENPFHTDFAYTTDPASAFPANPAELRRTGYRGYAFECIDGYLYPKNQPQPPGTVRLLQKYNPERDDHAVFPETKLSTMIGQGYTVDSGEDWLGYVYLNSGTGEPDWRPW